MKKLILIGIIGLAVSPAAHAQFSDFDNSAGRTFTMTNDENSLQIGGRTSGYFEDRFLKSGETNLDHNGWALKDMDFDVLGRTGKGAKKFEYEFHVSFVDLATSAATRNTADPFSPGIKAAYLQYVGCPIHIKLGYDKLPFSQSSITDDWATPYWSHDDLDGGDLFSRRDWGITFNYTTLASKLNLYAGAYSGMGETFFEYGNDKSGTLEYAARAEFSFPGKIAYRLTDEENSPKPQFRLAVNARYFDKTQPAGSSQGAGFITAYPDAVGMYDMRVFDGKRLLYGGDMIFKYKGIAFTFEEDLIKAQPNSQSDPLYNGTSESTNKNVVNAGGFVTNLSYTYNKWHSVLAVQYQDINANDLMPGIQQWFNIAYAYKINGFNSVAKIEYYIPTEEDKVSNPLKYTGQLRVGYQIVF
jgi:hypothetical protein